MGSCISKCKPKKTPKKEKQPKECQCIEQNNKNVMVQDKLVISQAPISTPQSPSKPSLVSPLSPSTSSSSPSFSCTKSNYPTTTTSSSSSSSSCSSLSSASSFASSTSLSILSSKLDRSFSNDFLWSCVKENPHLIRPDFPVKINVNPKPRSSLPTRGHSNTNKQLIGPKQHPPSPQRVSRPVAQKRPRCSSPSNLTRQKSFRREPDGPVLGSNKDVRPISPSPSRRFKGEVVTTSMRRENFHIRPRSPSNVTGSRRYGRPNNSLVKKDNEGIKRIGSKIEELGLGDLISGQAQEMDWLPLEDVNNPHIALDCFIFL